MVLGYFKKAGCGLDLETWLIYYESILFKRPKIGSQQISGDSERPVTPAPESLMSLASTGSGTHMHIPPGRHTSIHIVKNIMSL